MIHPYFLGSLSHYSSWAFIYLHHSLYSRKAVIKKDFVQSSLTGFSELKFIWSRFPHILLRIECFLFHSLFLSGKTQKRPNNIIRGREQFVGNYSTWFQNTMKKLLIVSMHFLDIKTKNKNKAWNRWFAFNTSNLFQKNHVKKMFLT